MPADIKRRWSVYGAGCILVDGAIVPVFDAMGRHSREMAAVLCRLHNEDEPTVDAVRPHRYYDGVCLDCGTEMYYAEGKPCQSRERSNG